MPLPRTRLKTLPIFLALSLTLLFPVVGKGEDEDAATKEFETKEKEYQEERAALNQELQTEKVPVRREEITRRLSEIEKKRNAFWNDMYVTKTNILFKKWKSEKDSERRKEIERNLTDAAIGAGKTEIINEVARDGIPERWIADLPKAETVKLTRNFIFKDNYDNRESLITRRITDDRVELWTPTEGWLFDDDGKLLHHVTVPRRDGNGRDWFGAFLPNGYWVTTDLWEWDRTLTCYSPEGKWLWEIPGDKIMPRKNEYIDYGLVASAQSDKNGDGWVVAVGAYGARGFAWVSPNRKIRQPIDGWESTYPRTLGPRGFYTSSSVPSDDGESDMRKSEAPHGVFVGYPVYDLPKKTVMICGGENHFGFWPKSKEVYIESGSASAYTKNNDRTPCVWFFDEEGRYRAQIRAKWLGDAENHRDLLLQDESHVVLQMDPKLKVRNARRFVWSEKGETAEPLEIYDDLEMGFFLKKNDKGEGQVVLARW